MSDKMKDKPGNTGKNITMAFVSSANDIFLIDSTLRYELCVNELLRLAF